jgi:hypothetical protein
MSQRSTRKTKGALWAHAASKSAWDTNTGSFYQTSRGRSAPLPHTPPTRTHCRGAASEEILFGGGFGFPPGLPYRKRPYGSGAIFQVRWSGAASGARAAAARTGPYGQPLFSAGCKGPRAKIPLMGACACPLRRRWFFLKKTTLAKHTNKFPIEKYNGGKCELFPIMCRSGAGTR